MAILTTFASLPRAMPIKTTIQAKFNCRCPSAGRDLRHTDAIQGVEGYSISQSNPSSLQGTCTGLLGELIY